MRFFLLIPVLLAFSAIADAQASVAKLFLWSEPPKPQLQPGTLGQDQGRDIGLHIEILKGDGGVNDLKTKTAVTPLIEVRDRNNLPLVGIPVTFTAPGDGPSVIFLNGSRSMTVPTNSSGQVSLEGMTPVNEGQFRIGVSASFQSQTAITEISLNNTATAEDEGRTVPHPVRAPNRSNSKMIAILIGVGAAAAVGIGVGLGHHGGSTPSGSTSSTSSATIGLGSGGSTAGPPS
jgi:hypothetical protein